MDEDTRSEITDMLSALRERVEALESSMSAEISLSYETIDAIQSLLDEATD